MIPAVSVIAAVVLDGWHWLAAVGGALIYMGRLSLTIFLTILKNLPEILALINALRNDIKASGTDRTVKSDLSALKGAIDAKNIDQVNHMFNAPAGSVDSGVQPSPDQKS